LPRRGLLSAGSKPQIPESALLLRIYILFIAAERTPRNWRLKMPLNEDWLSTTRTGQLAMANVWIEGCTPKKTAWNIPESDLINLTSVRDLAAVALEAATNESTRTPVATARCKTMFGHLTEFMRYFKRHYLMSPPLSEADLVSLGLKPHDKHPTPSGVPTAQVKVETYYAGLHVMGVRMLYVFGDPKDRANKAYQIWYHAVEPGETPPARPEELDKLFPTQRKKDIIGFDFSDSGKMVYFAVRVVNGDMVGEWGPMESGRIP
jgi:hypothetical protein